jgi:hypothetical protein
MIAIFEYLKNWTNLPISVYGSLSVGSGVQGQTYTVSNTVGTTGSYILIQFSSGNSKNIYITKSHKIQIIPKKVLVVIVLHCLYFLLNAW